MLPPRTAAVLTVAPVSQIEDGQIQEGNLRTFTLSVALPMATSTVTEHGCNGPIKPTPTPEEPQTTTPLMPMPTTLSTSMTSTRPPASSTTPRASAPRASLVSCVTNSTLQLTLRNNVLYDSFQRTGYIASNYQFQFDRPPQSGSRYTSGWSICPVITDVGEDNDGTSESGVTGLMTLALGDSTTFYECLSGEFYNLYEKHWAAQCSPVEIRVVGLVECDE